jgi:hypothetical protein
MRLPILFSVLLLIACSRQEALQTLTPESVAGTWLKTGETANSQDLWCLYYYDTCALDDAWRFERDGSYAIIGTGMTCPTGSRQEGNWKIEGDRLRIDSTVYKVVRCNEELWLQGVRVMNGFAVQHGQRFRRP